MSGWQVIEKEVVTTLIRVAPVVETEQHRTVNSCRSYRTCPDECRQNPRQIRVRL